MHRLSYRDTLVLRQRTETPTMISKEELDYVNTPLEDIVDAWLALEPKILENATREELTAFLSDVKEAIKAE